MVVPVFAARDLIQQDCPDRSSILLRVQTAGLMEE